MTTCRMLSLLGAGVCRLPSAHSGQHQDWRGLLSSHADLIQPVLAERAADRRALMRWRAFMAGRDVNTVRLLTRDLWRSRYGMARSTGWANVERELAGRC